MVTPSTIQHFTQDTVPFVKPLTSSLLESEWTTAADYPSSFSTNNSPLGLDLHDDEDLLELFENPAAVADVKLIFFRQLYCYDGCASNFVFSDDKNDNNPPLRFIGTAFVRGRDDLEGCGKELTRLRVDAATSFKETDKSYAIDADSPVILLEAVRYKTESNKLLADVKTNKFKFALSNGGVVYIQAESETTLPGWSIQPDIMRKNIMAKKIFRQEEEGILPPSRNLLLWVVLCTRLFSVQLLPASFSDSLFLSESESDKGPAKLHLSRTNLSSYPYLPDVMKWFYENYLGGDNGELGGSTNENGGEIESNNIMRLVFCKFEEGAGDDYTPTRSQAKLTILGGDLGEEVGRVLSMQEGGLGDGFAPREPKDDDTVEKFLGFTKLIVGEDVPPPACKVYWKILPFESSSILMNMNMDKEKEKNKNGSGSGKTVGVEYFTTCNEVNEQLMKLSEGRNWKKRNVKCDWLGLSRKMVLTADDGVKCSLARDIVSGWSVCDEDDDDDDDDDGEDKIECSFRRRLRIMTVKKGRILNVWNSRDLGPRKETLEKLHVKIASELQGCVKRSDRKGSEELVFSEEAKLFGSWSKNLVLAVSLIGEEEEKEEEEEQQRLKASGGGAGLRPTSVPLEVCFFVGAKEFSDRKICVFGLPVLTFFRMGEGVEDVRRRVAEELYGKGEGGDMGGGGNAQGGGERGVEVRHCRGGGGGGRVRDRRKIGRLVKFKYGYGGG